MVRRRGPVSEPFGQRLADLEAENLALRRALVQATADAGRAGEAGKRGFASSAVPARSVTDSQSQRIPSTRSAFTLAESLARLRESEERLSLVLDSATGFAVFTTDLDCCIQTWNGGAERLLGWAASEIIGLHAEAIFAPEDRTVGVPQAEALKAIAFGRAEDERWHQRQDGTRLWANSLVMPLREANADPGASPRGLLFILRDRTVEWRAGEALRESETHLRHTVDLSPQIPWTADRDGRITGFSQQWLKVTGLTRDEALGEGWRRVPHLDDLGRMEAAWAQAVKTGEAYDLEARLRSTDGAYRWWRVRAFPRRDEQGAVLGWYGTTEDVHERRLAETRLAALVELSDRTRDLAEPGAISTIVAEVVGRTLSAARAGYGTLDANAEVLRIERDWTAPGVASAVGEWQLADYWTGNADAIRRGEVVVVADVAHDFRTRALVSTYSALGVGAAMHVPLLEAGRLAALMFVHAAKPRRWSEEEIAFVHDATERARAATLRARSEVQLGLLVRELNHRVKNTLAVVLSLAHQTARGATSTAAFADAFQGRLMTLARAHDLLTRRNWEGAALSEVVRATLEPLGASRLDFGDCTSGMLLVPGAALSLAMALHELATNALKHGALSVPEGQVSVACTPVSASGGQVLEWVEWGGPPVPAGPPRTGFGLRLLGHGLAGMAVRLSFEPEGLRCAVQVPFAIAQPR